MGNFITDDFLLQTPAARELYHNYAKDLPIIDYHSHLPPAEINRNRSFETITNIWLDGDHYKWRAMRTLGIDEKYITGSASDREKFQKWAETVPYTMRNPLYHWTHMELKNYFGIESLLNPDSADEIYNSTNEQLQEPEFSARSLLQRMDVEVSCTTDDPVDSLEHHQAIQDSGFEVTVLPAFRPDAAYNFVDPESYNNYIEKLEEASGLGISSLDDLLKALEQRIDYFHENGCRLSDHGLERLHYLPTPKTELDSYYNQIRNNDKQLDNEQKQALTCHILLQLGRTYTKKGWVQQFHLGALRNANQRMYEKMGPAVGFDSIGDFQQSRSLARFLNELDLTNELPKTILYNLNPADNEVMATMTGNFNDGSEKGKIQYGSAWWFLDQKDGMEEQMNVLSNMGLLSCFVGMLTDSRSFLSFPRHEYFRRILCNLIGNDIDNGELPGDIEWLGKIVSDICYYNAKEYFNFHTVTA
ncbi:glucuronate isomerase [Aliifodinibius sp. S!AR15-10]|uniref:glucuronate isomerase n=1 Tax=Aliifodinibius sp. S!AR15-10 TaxID=2950437 RepID=UPI00285A8D62|nr:glucuronate isomerase [Aliifodinibius sp. S!AR15-10]MDR8390073.1 glucuronate isomerase [Aliifodinibius sp. S!AR15-10]